MSNLVHVSSGAMDLVVESFGAGPPLVFAHGLSGNRRSTKRQLTPLAPRYRVVVFDQRGHGDSTPVTDPAGYDLNDMAEDMSKVMDALEIDRAVIGGESMGAATALHFALCHPERVDRLLLTAPAFGDSPNTEADRFQEIAAAIDALGMERFLEAARHTWHNDMAWPPDVIEHVSGMFRSHAEKSLVTAINTVIQWVPLPSLEMLQRVTCPTCVIYWNDDALHPAELTARMAAQIPQARVVQFPPLPAVFQQPEAVGEIYARFLTEVEQ